ncbi:MAG: acyltransferase [Bradyrhizobiaceae bacterium]|nr:MAG: acyltransferase [Bradyrhizobiaceae bacterium]
MARNAALDRARTALTVLVVIHHAVLPYTYYGHLDRKTWLGFDSVALANDSFFMALFFFLSGLFTWPSLRHKSIGHFLRDRFLRLGLPYAIAAVFLMPLAYYAIELRSSNIGFGDYWWRTVTTGPWPSGPVWFVWVLLAYDLLAALLFRIAPNCLEPINRLSLAGFTRPLIFFLVFFALTALAYVPMRMIYGVNKWFEFGPLTVQASRVFLYACYFFIGAGVGLANMDRGLLANAGNLARRWGVWALTALATYLMIVALVYYRRAILPDPDVLPQWWEVAYAFALPLFSASIAFAILAWFIHFDRPGWGILDTMQPAAYGIFLIHYVPVLWTQYWLASYDIPAFVKALISFAAGLGVSWAATLALLRLPGARRVL